MFYSQWHYHPRPTLLDWNSLPRLRCPDSTRHVRLHGCIICTISILKVIQLYSTHTPSIGLEAAVRTGPWRSGLPDVAQSLTQAHPLSLIQLARTGWSTNTTSNERWSRDCKAWMRFISWLSVTLCTRACWRRSDLSRWWWFVILTAKFQIHRMKWRDCRCTVHTQYKTYIPQGLSAPPPASRSPVRCCFRIPVAQLHLSYKTVFAAARIVSLFKIEPRLVSLSHPCSIHSLWFQCYYWRTNGPVQVRRGTATVNSNDFWCCLGSVGVAEAGLHCLSTYHII